jgi:hypothetical protein
MKIAQILNDIKLPVVGSPDLNINNPLTIGEIISVILKYVFTIAGILLLIYFLIGGFGLIFATGDPKKVQSAWSKITNALIGFVIVILAYFLTQLFGRILNIQALNNIFK